MANKPYHKGEYTKRAKAVRLAAYANPATTCWRCGLTHAQHGRRWQAGHVNDGDVNSPLLPECELCNTRAGQARGEALKRARGEWAGPSRAW
jgi:hypothetical protein